MFEVLQKIAEAERELWNIRQLGHTEISPQMRARENILVHRLTLLHSLVYFCSLLGSHLDTVNYC